MNEKDFQHLYKPFNLLILILWVKNRKLHLRLYPLCSENFKDSKFLNDEFGNVFLSKLRKSPAVHAVWSYKEQIQFLKTLTTKV